MSAFRAVIFLMLAVSVIGIGAFIGGAIAQPSLLGLIPWYHDSAQRI